MASASCADGPLLFSGQRPRVCATPRTKTQMREVLGAIVKAPSAWASVAASVDQHSIRPVVLMDWTEKFFIRTNGDRESALVPGQRGVVGAALVNSMLAPFVRPVGGSATRTARPIVGVGSVDTSCFVPRAKDVAHAYRAESGHGRLSEVEAVMVLRVLLEEDIVIPALPQAMRASPVVARGVLDWLVERLARVLRTSRPPRAYPGFFLIVSGAHDVPLLIVQEAPGAPEPTPARLPTVIETTWRVRHLRDNVWEAPGLAHQVGEADMQHFYFMQALSDPVLGLNPDAFWIVSKDGDAAFNSVLFCLLCILIFGFATPLRIYVPQRSQKCKSYTEAPSVVAQALAERHGGLFGALSFLLALAAAGNDYVPSLAMRVPRAFADAFPSVPRHLVTICLEDRGAPDEFNGRNALVHEVIDGSDGCPHHSLAHVRVRVAGGRSARLSFDLCALTDFLQNPRIKADYVQERVRILVAFFVYTVQLGNTRHAELDWREAPGVRFGFWPGSDGKLLWDFRPRPST